jgi:hypothetical protein
VRRGCRGVFRTSASSRVACGDWAKRGRQNCSYAWRVRPIASPAPSRATSHELAGLVKALHAARSRYQGDLSAEHLHLMRCGRRLGLHPNIWPSCGEARTLTHLLEGESPIASAGWLSAALRRRLRDGGSLLMLGDSMMRTLFVTAACLLDTLTPLAAPPNTNHAERFGYFGAVTSLRTTDGSALHFAELRDYEGTRANGSIDGVFSGWYTAAATEAMRRASVVVMGGGAHYRSSRALRRAHEDTMRWLRWVNANASVIVLEYSPTHFPASPMGEFEHWRSRAARTRAEHHPRRGGSSRGGGEDNGEDDGGMGCAPHQRSLGTSALEKGRRDAGVGFAEAHGLPVLRTWSRSVRSYDDHPGKLEGGSEGGADPEARLDCRHWCAPGRTNFAMLEKLATQMLLESAIIGE